MAVPYYVKSSGNNSSVRGSQNNQGTSGRVILDPATPAKGAASQPSNRFSADTFSRYENEYNTWKTTGKNSAGYSAWGNQNDYNIWKNIRDGKFKAAQVGGDIYFMDSDSYNRYSKEYDNWSLTGKNSADYNTWANKNELDAFKYIRDDENGYGGLNNLKASLDDELAQAVADKYRSQWGDKYYYDVSNYDDILAMNAGQMPAYLRKKYKANDPIDQYLLEHNLPYSSLFNDMYSEAWNDRIERRQKEQAEAAEKSQARKAMYDTAYNDIAGYANSMADLRKAMMEGTRFEDALASGEYDILGGYYDASFGKTKEDASAAEKYFSGKKTELDPIYERGYDAIMNGETPDDEFFDHYKDSTWKSYIKKKNAWNESSLKDLFDYQDAQAAAAKLENDDRHADTFSFENLVPKSADEMKEAGYTIDGNFTMFKPIVIGGAGKAVVVNPIKPDGTIVPMSEIKQIREQFEKNTDGNFFERLFTAEPDLADMIVAEFDNKKDAQEYASEMDEAVTKAYGTDRDDFEERLNSVSENRSLGGGIGSYGEAHGEQIGAPVAKVGTAAEPDAVPEETLPGAPEEAIQKTREQELFEEIQDINEQIGKLRSRTSRGGSTARQRERIKELTERRKTLMEELQTVQAESRETAEAERNERLMQVDTSGELSKDNQQKGALEIDQAKAVQTVSRYTDSITPTDTITPIKRVKNLDKDNREFYAALTGQKYSVNKTRAGRVTLEPSTELSQYATESEIAVLNGIVESGESPNDYLDALKDVCQMRRFYAAEDETRTQATLNPLETSLLSVPTNMMGAIEYPINALGAMTGDYNSIDVIDNSRFTNLTTGIRGTVSENIQKENSSDSIIPGVTAGQIYSFLYSTGMSTLDSAARFILGKGGLAVAGSSAANTELIEQLKKGNSMRRALVMSAIAGGAEVITEKFSLENLIKMSKGETVLSFGKALWEIAKQGLVEGSEETASELINLVADIVVNNGTDLLNDVEAARELHPDWTEKKLNAYVIANRFAVAGLGGFVSGVLMGGAAAPLTNARVSLQNDATSNAIDLTLQAVTDVTKNLADPETIAKMEGDMLSLAMSDSLTVATNNIIDELRLNPKYMETDSGVQKIAQLSEFFAKEAADAATAQARADTKAAALQRTREAASRQVQDLFSRIQQKQQAASEAFANGNMELHGRLLEEAHGLVEQYKNFALPKYEADMRVADAKQSEIDLAEEQRKQGLEVRVSDLLTGMLDQMNQESAEAAAEAEAIATEAEQSQLYEEISRLNAEYEQAAAQGDTETMARVESDLSGWREAYGDDTIKSVIELMLEEGNNGENTDGSVRGSEAGAGRGSETELPDGERGRINGSQEEWSDETGLRTGAGDRGPGTVGSDTAGPAKSWLGVDHTALFKTIAKDFNRAKGLHGRKKISASDFQILTEPTSQRSAEVLSKAITRNGGGSVYLYRSTNPNAPNGFVYRGNIYINDAGNGLVAFYYAHELTHGNGNDNAIQRAGREVWKRLLSEGSNAFDRYCKRWGENAKDPKVMNEFFADIRGAYEYAIQNNRAVHDQLGLTAAEAVQFYREFSRLDTERASEGSDFQTAIHEAATGSTDTDFNFHSMDEDRAGYRQDLIDSGLVGDGKTMSYAELDNLFNAIDKVMDIVGKNRGVLDFFGDAGRETRAYKPYKTNADPHYKLALDFSTLCRKRVLLQSIAERLQAQLGRSITPEETVAIRNEIQKYKDEGKRVEVACALCYVEAARLKSPKVINKFLDNRQKYMTDYFAKKNSSFMTSVHDAQAAFKVERGYAPDATKKQMKPADVKDLNKLTPKLRSEYQPSAEEQEIINKAVTMPRDRYLSAGSLTKMATEDPEIYDAFTSAVRSATRSKAQESAVPYFRGDIASVGQNLIDEMNEESGFRHQSWSDFETIHLLDNMAAVIELATRGAKVHAYTKVPNMVIVNGNTGMMLNMSLIPAGQTGILNEDDARMQSLIDQYAEAVRTGGDTNAITEQITEMLTMDPNEGMPRDQMETLRQKFHATAGNIMIGINDTQIRALLASGLIDYVIPYHTSGLNKDMRRRMGIKAWNDYTSFQNEKANKRGPAGEAPHLSEWFNIEDAKKAPDGVRYMQEASQRYLDLCYERNLDPKFPQFLNQRADGSYELADDALNYWKLLIDRKMVDQETGKVIEQQKILPNFNQADLETILQNELDSPLHGDDQEVADAIIDKVMAGELEISKDIKEEARRLKEGALRMSIQEAGRAGTEFSGHNLVDPENVTNYQNVTPSDPAETPKEYTYDYLIKQKPIKVIDIPTLEDIGIVNGKMKSSIAKGYGMARARKLANGKKDVDGLPVVVNRYNNREISIKGASISHSVKGAYPRMATNATLGAVLPDLVANGLPINKLKTPSDEKWVNDSYLIAAYGQGIVDDELNDFVAVITIDHGVVKGVELERTHSINGKRSPENNRTLIDTVNEIVDDDDGRARTPTKTVEEFLSIVNRLNPSILSAEVRTHPQFSWNRDTTGYYTGMVYSSHNLKEGTNPIEDTVIRNAQIAQDLYNSGESVADYMARSVYDPEVAAQLGGIERRNTPAPTGLTRDQRSQMYQWDRERLNAQYRNLKSEERARLIKQRQDMENRQSRNKSRKSIIESATELRNWMTTPNPKEGKFVPDFLKDAVSGALQAIDLGSESREGGRAVQNWRQSMQNLANVLMLYQRHQDGSAQDARFEGTYLDLPENFAADFLDLANSIGEDGTNYLQDMDADQTKRLDVSLKILKSAIRNANRLQANSRYQSVAEAGVKGIQDMAGMKKKRQHSDNFFGRIAGAVDDLLNVEMRDAYSFGRSLGDAGSAIIKAIGDGFLKGTTHVREAQEAFTGMRERNGVSEKDIHKWSNTGRTFTLESGEKIGLSVAQVMDLYNFSKRPQAMQHILNGGIELAKNKFSKGSQNRAYKLTYADLDNMFSTLTESQKSFADDLQTYLSTTASGWGNEVSQTRYNIDQFGEEFYWPIKSARSNLATQDPEKTRAFNAIDNSGITKAVNPHANNPIMIGDCVDTFCNHVSQMANYNGMAIPIADAMKWFNFRGRNADGTVDFNSSIKRSVQDVMGKGGIDYFVNLIKDINGLSEGGTGTALPSVLVSNTKKAAVAGKLRVVIQQPTAVVRAMSMVNPVYFAGLDNARLGRVVKEMHDNAPIAWWKSQGNYEIGTGKSIRDIISGDASALERAQNVAMAPAGLADDLGWAIIWNAVKREQKARTHLTGDALLKATAERFTDVINETQVIDTVMHRSQIMRSKDSLVKQGTAFMSEPIKTFNLLHNALNDAVNGKPGAKGRLAKTTVAVLASWALNAAVLALHDSLRDRDDDDELEELIAENFRDEMLSNVNPINSIPYLKDVASLLQGYDVDRMDLSNLSDMVTSLQRVWKAVKTGDTNYTDYGLMRGVFTSASNLLGLPLSGLLNSAEVVINAAEPGAIRTKKTKGWDKADALIEEGIDKKSARGLMKSYNQSNNATKALSILTYDRDRDGVPDFDTEEQNLIAEVLGLSYSPEKDGTLEDWAVKSAQKYMAGKEKKLDNGEITEEQYDDYAAVFDDYFEMLGLNY